MLTFLPQAEYEALQAARQWQETPAFWERYALRAGVERTIGQAVRFGDVRHSRSFGLARTHLQHLITAVALTVLRVLAWLDEGDCQVNSMSRSERGGGTRWMEAPVLRPRPAAR